MPPVWLIPVANLPTVSFDTGSNFAAGVKFATNVVDTGGAP
jgi:hypothetical protein